MTSLGERLTAQRDARLAAQQAAVTPAVVVPDEVKAFVEEQVAAAQTAATAYVDEQITALAEYLLIPPPGS